MFSLLKKYPAPEEILLYMNLPTRGALRKKRLAKGESKRVF
jgi:hypothetical protein